jgi:hypothetical protein
LLQGDFMLDKENIKIIIINKPNENEANEKIKALCDLLEKVWIFDKPKK